MVKHQVQVRLMGSNFELIVVDQDDATASQNLETGVREIQRIEDLLTEFSDHSQTAILNRQAGRESIRVHEEFYQLIQRCLHLSALTQGAFDISAVALRSLYNFKEGQTTLPDAATLAAKLQKVGYRHIHAADGKISLTKTGMRIGFGAIGKGYASDMVKALWRSRGVTAGVINASGDLTAWGRRPDGSPWKIGIADPREPSRIMLWLPVENAAVATSGNYEQFFEIDGRRYSHNIDPRTGIPVRDVKSATIISPSAELSDALATAVTVMGVATGLDLIGQLPDTHGIIIDNKDRVFTSKNIQKHVYN